MEYKTLCDQITDLQRELHAARVLLRDISQMLKCGCLATSLCDDHDHTTLNAVETMKEPGKPYDPNDDL